MKLYTIVNMYDDGYESFSKEGNGDTFSSRKLAEEAMQYLIDEGLGIDDGEFGDHTCHVYAHEVYKDLETWKKELV